MTVLSVHNPATGEHLNDLRCDDPVVVIRIFGIGSLHMWTQDTSILADSASPAVPRRHHDVRGGQERESWRLDRPSSYPSLARRATLRAIRRLPVLEEK